MIKSITATNYVGDTVKLILRDPWKTGLAVASCDGLGPVHANISFVEFSTIDGAIDNFAKAESRTIKLSLIFIDCYMSIEDARHKTYKFFPLKTMLRFEVETDTRTVYTIGRIESNEPDIFSKQEGCSISIKCPSPWFYDAEREASIQLNALMSAFHFPFANNINPVHQFQFIFGNNSLTKDLLQFYDQEIERYLKFGDIDFAKDRILYYDGEVETGITITIDANGQCKNPIFANSRTKQVMKINTDMLDKLTGSVIEEGDTIVICTEPGYKSMTLYRDGDEINIINCLDRRTDWLTIKQGENHFSYTAEEGEQNIEVKVSAKIVYQGV